MSDFLGQANFEEGDEDLRRAIELSLDGVHLDSSTNPSSAGTALNVLTFWSKRIF